MGRSTITSRLTAGCMLLAFGSAALQAQTIYRFIGPDGKITFSDKAPGDATKVTATTAAGKPIGTADAAAPIGLPYDLRQIMSRYPVTLYSSPSCAPCNSGRLLLQGRGVPFTEHSISTPEDGEALQRISGDNSLPFLTIGGQKIKGYSEAEWVQFLNAANYPAASVLPANYRNPPARPLVTVQRPPSPQSPAQAEAQTNNEEKSAASPANAPSTAGPSNPGGIKF